MLQTILTEPDSKQAPSLTVQHFLVLTNFLQMNNSSWVIYKEIYKGES